MTIIIMFIIVSSITDGTAYLSSWLWRARDLPVWGEGRGNSWFDGGLPYYDTYECKDGTYVAVGCLEKPFFDQLLAGKLFFRVTMRGIEL